MPHRSSCRQLTQFLQKNEALQALDAVMRSLAAVHNSILLQSFLQYHFGYNALMQRASTAQHACTTLKRLIACVQLLYCNTHTLPAGLFASSCDAFVPAAGALRSAQLARCSSALRMASTSDFKTGLTIEVDGAPVRVIEFLHVKVSISTSI